MIIREVDVDGDWMFGKGRNNYLSGIDAVAENISTRLKCFLGDCFFALNFGIDWFNLLGSKNQLALELATRAVILNTPDVTRLVSASTSLDQDTRRLTINYQVDTSFSGGTFLTASTTIAYLTTEDGSILTTEDGDALILG